MNKPNILLIITEQQRGECLGCDGHPVLLTPTMDNIARNGVRFSKAYADCPGANTGNLLRNDRPAGEAMPDRIRYLKQNRKEI